MALTKWPPLSLPHPLHSFLSSQFPSHIGLPVTSHAIKSAPALGPLLLLCPLYMFMTHSLMTFRSFLKVTFSARPSLEILDKMPSLLPFNIFLCFIFTP